MDGTPTSGKQLAWVPCTRLQAPQDWLSRMKRRRGATHRLPPLDCGCRDPWPCRCTEPPLTEQRIDAAREAALHILANGQVPLLQIEELRALYRRGGNDRALAEELHRLAGGVIA